MTEPITAQKAYQQTLPIYQENQRKMDQHNKFREKDQKRRDEINEQNCRNQILESIALGKFSTQCVELSNQSHQNLLKDGFTITQSSIYHPPHQVIEGEYAMERQVDGYTEHIDTVSWDKTNTCSLQ